MVFIEVFMAVFTAQLCVWIIERYIKKQWEKAADRLESHIKPLFKNGMEGKMVKVLNFRLEKTDNNKYIVDVKGEEVNVMARLGGIKTEHKVLTFNDSKEFATWLDKEV